MTEADIAEMFTKAAETEIKLPSVKGMNEDWGRYPLQWFHDLGDVNMRRREGGDRLDPKEGDPFDHWRWAWLDPKNLRLNTKAVTQWEACINITREFLADAGQRRALWAWAMAQAKSLRSPKGHHISFARWCRDVEKIAEMTGHRRKNRALTRISQEVCGKQVLHDENHHSGLLPCEPENGHVFATVEGQRTVHDARPVYKSTWRDDPSFQPGTISLAALRAARRRQQEAKRKREAA